MVILVVFKLFYWLKIWKYWSKLSQIALFVPTTIDIILMYFFDIISMDGKSTQIQRASFINVLLKGKTS